jgi:NitT/TauT family transport system substrate-binding protein
MDETAKGRRTMAHSTGMDLTRRNALIGAAAGLAAMGASAAANAQTGDQKSAVKTVSAPLAFFGAQMAVERAPVHMAMLNLYGDRAIVQNGSNHDLIGFDRRAVLFSNPRPSEESAAFDLKGRTLRADVSSNGETQMMRASAIEPKIRVIMTVAEGRYPIIAQRSAGIASLADLKGKRILNFPRPPTSAAFFLHNMLKSVGLTASDVTIVQQPLGKIGEAVTKGMVDAVAIWEPDSEQALTAFRALGEDVVIFNGDGIYHERYNLCTTTDALAVPAKRREIVSLLREIIKVTSQINTDPVVRARAQALVAESGGLYTVEEVARGWPNVKFVASFDENLLDLFVAEDIWLAPLENRKPRARKDLARLIDRTLYDEARAG